MCDSALYEQSFYMVLLGIVFLLTTFIGGTHADDLLASSTKTQRQPTLAEPIVEAVAEAAVVALPEVSFSSTNTAEPFSNIRFRF